MGMDTKRLYGLTMLNFISVDLLCFWVCPPQFQSCPCPVISMSFTFRTVWSPLMETQMPLWQTWTGAAQQCLPFSMDTPTSSWTTRVSFTPASCWYFPASVTFWDFTQQYHCFSLLCLEMIAYLQQLLCSALRFPSLWTPRSRHAGCFATSQQHHLCCGAWILGCVSFYFWMKKTYSLHFIKWVNE